MSQVLDDLVALLSLESIEENLFRGTSQDLGFRQLFGGQVVGQALSAATQTVEPDRPAHSLHGYFLRPGDADMRVLCQVDRVRDGGRFTTRRVTAIQKGKPIFFLSASFQIVEPGFEHQIQMPDVPQPEGLESETELAKRLAEQLPQRIRERVLGERPIEIRAVRYQNPLAPGPALSPCVLPRDLCVAVDSCSPSLPDGLFLRLQSATHLHAAAWRVLLAEVDAGSQP